jgi:hypothetical protein
MSQMFATTIGGVGASSTAALVGFVLARNRWGHLAGGHQVVPVTSGYVVAARCQAAHQGGMS